MSGVSKLLDYPIFEKREIIRRKASASLKGGGTAMFALLALAGDLGCSGGPTLAGIVSGHFQDNLRIGILAAIIFPVVLLVGLAACRKQGNGKTKGDGKRP